MKELEKKVNKEKKKSNAVVSGFQGFLSSRNLQKYPLDLESVESSFDSVHLKKKKSRKRFKRAVKTALREQDLDKVNMLKDVSLKISNLYLGDEEV